MSTNSLSVSVQSMPRNDLLGEPLINVPSEKINLTIDAMWLKFMKCLKVYSLNKLEVLYQIPTGSISVQKGNNTKTEFVSIGSYSGKNLEFYFYFPAPGQFQMFPVQISKKGRVCGFEETKDIIVSLPTEAKEVNLDSWDEVSIEGTEKDVLHYLNSHNLYETSLSRIYWRLNDAKFFKLLTQYLRKQRFYDNTIWQYS